MHRSIATSTIISIAIHAALLIGLIGFRFETSEKPALGVVQVAWVVLDDRIDSGSGPRGAVSAAAPLRAASADPVPRTAPHAVEPVAPDPVEPVGADSVPPGTEGAAGPAAADRHGGAEAALTSNAALRSSVSTETRPQRRDLTAPAFPTPVALPAPLPEPPQLAESPPTDAFAETLRAARPAPLEAPRPALPLPAVDIAVESPEVLENANARGVRSAAASAKAPPQSNPLVAEVATLTRDADVLSRPGTVDFEHEGQEYTATFRASPAAHDMALDELIVAVNTERGGNLRTTEMRFKRLAFSHFAQFVDRWDPAVQIHDDEIDGRFHSNSEIYIDTSRGIEPRFHGKVTTSRGISSRSATGSLDRGDVFRGGLETRVGRILLKKEPALLPAKPEFKERTHRFDEDVRITFYADGSYGWQPVDSAMPERRRSMADATYYLLGTDDARLFVRGIVNGRVLVRAHETIVIEGDLTYAADPRVQPDADDYLGLISEKNVEVAKPEVTGPGDLEVHAAIYAKRRFVIQRYRAREGATLSILGSVTAGSLTASEPRYRTRLRFDTRLEDVRPPSFPMTDRYELASWDGRWTMKQGRDDASRN